MNTTDYSRMDFSKENAPEVSYQLYHDDDADEMPYARCKDTVADNNSGVLELKDFDIKNLISYPSLLSKIGDEIYKLIDKDCDLICGVPIGGIPISTYISTKYHIPMIIPRKEIKKYGTQKLIEGEFKSTDKCVIIEDVITSGSSVRETLNLLKDKVTAIEVIVIIDRQQNYQCELPVKSFLTKTDIVRERLYKIVQEIIKTG